jgi:glyoxylase-like metal-dependent hydrolase (beta-lactamase superfamily II)
MKRLVLRAAFCCTLAALLSVPLSAQAVLESTARAMGGADRIMAVRTLVVDATGENFTIGQNLTPDAPLPRFEVTQSRRSLDFANRRWQIDLTRVPRFTTGNTTPQRQRFGVDGDVAYNINNEGAMQRGGAQTASDRAAELLDHPIGFLQTALAPGAEVTITGSTIRLHSGGRRAVMVVDNATMLPTRIERTLYNNVLGDVPIAAEFSEWRDDAASGVKVPMRTVQRFGRWTVWDVRASAVTPNADVGDIAASAEARQQGAPTPPAPNVTVEEIAPGVWYLAGQSHHSVAIETSRNVVLVEAPQSDARTLAVIERARTLRPGKPVDMVINTHHHFDHSGGVRAAISQGLTVVTQEGNKDFYERTVFPNRHASNPDALTQTPKPLRLMPVGDKHVMRDSARTIELYRIDGSQHSGTMLMVYLPAEKLLIEADLYSPPAPNATTIGPFPFAARLLEEVQRRGLAVDRIVPIHGRVIPFSDLQSAATRTQ